jgi:hypothetical protein
MLELKKYKIRDMLFSHTHFHTEICKHECVDRNIISRQALLSFSQMGELMVSSRFPEELS